MKAGTLKDRITFEKPTRTPASSEAWEPVPGWAEYATCLAEVVPQPGGETVASDGVQSATRYAIRTRFMNNVKPSHRIRYAGLTLNITSVTEANRKRELAITATAFDEPEPEAVPNG